jgi:signal transduction histidine kinase
MSVANTFALVINGVTITLTLFMLILILWQDSRNITNLFFGILMIMLVIWSVGALVGRIAAYVGAAGSPLLGLSVHLLEIGFTGSALGLYLFAVTVSGGYGRLFLRVSSIALVIVLAYQSLIGLSMGGSGLEILPDGTLRYSFSSLSMLVYAGLMIMTIIVSWQRYRKVKHPAILVGICGFSVGMIIELISPELRSKSIGLDISAVSALVVSFAMVHVQIMEPLWGRAAQLKAVRDVGLSITSRVQLEEVLNTIAGQAAQVLQANGAAIFLHRGELLELAAVHNMPNAFLGHRLLTGDGLAGRVAVTRQSMRVENYSRDWTGRADMPYAKESFGSVVAVPLIFGDEVMGVLEVIEGQAGKRFDREDVRLLDLLGPQAAVAITNSRLFENQRALTGELEAAKNQLETVLTSTENPVVALNRKLEVIFANPAAVELAACGPLTGRLIQEILPPGAMPLDRGQALRDLYRRRIFTYELAVHERTYLCHLGLLGRPRPQGYVAVLNDISQLKELDRLKNQMIRMTSHDLKNPLAAAMAHVELLQEEGDDFGEQARSDVATIWTQLQRMNRIISGILDVERIQSGTLNYEECIIEQIVMAAVHEFQDQATAKHIDLCTQIAAELPTLTGNRQHLTQVMNNLIENAIKFTPSGGKISVGAEQVHGEVLVHVVDNGIGIPEEAQPRIFERFFRAYHPGREPIAGSGIGLSLVKAVIDAHKGRVWIESEVDKGTRIHLALPVRHIMLAAARD